MMGNKKLQVWLPLLFSLVMIVGMFFGYKLGKKGSSNFFASNDRNSLQEALDLIRLRYVDSVNADSLEGRAIQEMMAELDPHSVYFPPEELQQANEELEGNFDGIGVEFNIYDDTVNVVYVIPKGPSEAAGLKIGDRIISVNDSILTGRGYNTEEVKRFIKGRKGSKAELQVFRDGKKLAVSITRGSILMPSLDAAYMLDPLTGYIKLDRFSDQTYEEFMQSLELLLGKGMKSLVLDLRGNGGGFMNEAVDIADEFLDGEKLIVYTEGNHSRKREYKCKRPGLFETGKLVVLVDELSASASEVLAGALQDWCRARIVGRRSFGKGLVQEQYSLSDGSAIRLTVARYYTPLGRSIQRSYTKGKKIYMDEFLHRFTDGELWSEDSASKHSGKPYETVCRDTVYAGGGISPHYFVAQDTTSLRRIEDSTYNELFSHFVYSYYLANRQQVDHYKDLDDYNNRFNSAGLWEAYLQYAAKKKAKNGIYDPARAQILQKRLKAVLARYKWRNTGFFRVINEGDATIEKALEVLKR